MLKAVNRLSAVRTGEAMTAFVVAALLVDGTMQIFAPTRVAAMMQETGFAMELTPALGMIMFASAIVYGIPATNVLGAILVTGFLGGAICAHVRLGELGSPPEMISLLLGAMTWAGLYLRDARVRAVLSFNRQASDPLVLETSGIWPD